MHRLMYIFLIITVGAILAASDNNNSKLGDVIKNHTKYGNNGSRNDEENLLKRESHRLLRECGGIDAEGYDDTDYRRSYSNQNNRRANGERDNRNQNGNDGYGSQYPSNGNRGRNYYNNRRGNQQDNSNEYNNHYSNQNSRRLNGRNEDCKDDYGYHNNNRHFGGGHEGNYGYEHRNFGDTEYRGGGYDHLRAKRSNSNNYDSQCISQCVFGYMEVLDDNRVPSETMMIKWLQDHLSNDNMKRIRALREARRCFARLASEDNEDGCEFSQALSKCLELELE